MLKIIGALMIMIAEAFQNAINEDECKELTNKYLERGKDLMEGHTGEYVPVDIFSHTEKVLKMYEKFLNDKEVGEIHFLNDNNLPENFFSEALANHYKLVRKYPKPMVKKVIPKIDVDKGGNAMKKVIKKLDEDSKKDA